MLNEKISKHIKDIHWKAQESTPSSLLFYKIGNDEAAESAFSERIISSQFAWLVVNRSHPSLPPNSSIISEEKWPALQKEWLDRLYPLPSLKYIAITGTNGKTTTTDLVLQLGELLGKRGMSIGTLGVRENHRTIIDFGLTSPSLIDLRKFIFTYGQDKDFCVLEASSHALIQGRLFGMTFDGAGWLSFSQDHLDYHHSMAAYFDAKCLLLNHLTGKAKLFVPTEQRVLFEGVSSRSTKCFRAPEINDELPVFFRARFNRNNLEVAVAILNDVFELQISNVWNQLVPPDGRFFIRPYKSSFLVVDFAHTPDALENICKGIKEAFPQHRLKVLFGCGGDRDRTKRPQMGSVVDDWADYIYLTSDNPRSEDPVQIIDDIAKGVNHKEYKRITERPAAVQLAFSELKDKEVLLLAGKGHEDYILIKGVKHPYSDIREVENFIARNAK